ncbi:zinc finger CCCH domain-containing protein 32 [Magnolia sinica]|uniref:zinc finger CCCH domain-containing protein 32 n=1 Tax=Magnolia sinica TaxID=86752 RepID=UPI00265878DB|nr:zinc finger CCCH domain-containing protein 32 [Magnolia sinica]
MESISQDPSNLNLTPEEEAVKRNTDCVYFLASPLTCKKGNECEYRHSEAARMNPRDCWYWLNGNCLNPKCSFRHPRLEGLLGTPGAIAGSSLPPSQTTTSAQIPAAPAYNSNKQTVPCIYFQKGLCLKGDRCPFMHGSQPVGNSAPQQMPNLATTVAEPPQVLKKATTSLEKSTSQQKIPRVNIIKPIEVLPAARPVAQAEIMLNNGIAVARNMPPIPLYEELPRPKPCSIPIISGNAVSRPLSHQIQPLDEPFQNGTEAGEFLGESSPGFDVLVDDELVDSDYYRPEDEYGRTAGTTRRRLTSAEQDSLAKFDREPYNDFRDYDRHGRVQDRFGWEHSRASPERVFERPSMERRGLPREESPDRIDRSDLRHRLSKQRRVDGRSAASPDRHGGFYRRDDRRVEEQRYGGRSRRDQQHFPLDASISSRLQGRIILPGRSSPDKPNDSRSDKEMERGRNRGRSSPGRPISYQGRHHDRTRRTLEDIAAEARNFRGHPIRRDENDTLDFSGPKSLAELKGAKASDSSKDRLTNNTDVTAFKTQVVGEQKKMKSGKMGHQESDGSLSFEGPKPLSMILKRKRGAETGSGKVSSDGDNSSQSDRADPVGSLATAVTEASAARAVEFQKEDHAHSSYEEPRVTAGTVGTVEGEDGDDEGLIIAEGGELVHEGQSSAQKEEMLEMDDGMMIETVEEDQEPETSDQRDEEFDYEANEGGDENPDLEDEYLDDDDGDDFSRRIGAMLS